MRASERGGEGGRGGSPREGGGIRVGGRVRGSPDRTDRACQEFEMLYNRRSHKGSRDVKDRKSEREVGSHRQKNNFLIGGIGINFEMSKSVPLDIEPMPREEEGLREPSLLFSPQGKDESYVELKVRFLVVKIFRMGRVRLPLARFAMIETIF
jgi:hypothetical protein